MNDDFNTAKAVSVLFSIASEINKAVKNNDLDSAKNFAVILKTLASVLNIAQLDPNEFLQSSVDENALGENEILQLIEQRVHAKKDKNFALADQIRAELKAKGIELEDSRNGTSWRRI